MTILRNTRYPRSMSKKRALRAVDQGFRSITLDPSGQMRTLQRQIARRNTVAEAWNQTGQVLQASMHQVKANSSH